MDKVVGTENAFFFRGDRHEHDGTLGRLRKSGERSSDGHNGRGAAGVVQSAVINGISVNRWPNADVIHMSRVDDILVPQYRIGPRQHGHDVLALDNFVLHCASDRHLYRQIE
jgi:hypothetical protein